MTKKELKYSKRDINQASASGDLEKLKELFSGDSKNIKNILIPKGVYYSIRNGYVKCTEYLLSISEYKLDDIIIKYNLVYAIISKSIPSNRRIEMLKYLSDNCKFDIHSTILIKYARLRKKDRILECIELFRNKVNVLEILEKYIDNNKNRNNTFLIEIIRNEKLDSILK